jgi:hypothetical protein
MIIQDFLSEANIAARLRGDAKMAKRIGIAMRHDRTLPMNLIARLGPKPDDQQLLQAWSDLLDQTLSRTAYGDLSREGKFDEWLTRQYVNGQVDFEDINGEGGDALGAWQALSLRGKLEPADQDFNRFPSIGALQRAMRKPLYLRELERIKDQETIERHKREQRNIVVYEDENYWAAVLLNYGACYTFNNAAGYRANFCTGSSSGLSWFQRYAPDGLLLAVVNKNDLESANGKWQIHAATNQFVNADQDNRWNPQGNAAKFGEMFPGVMTAVVQGLQSNSDQIQEASAEIARGGYNVANEIQQLEQKFPGAFTAASAGNDNQETQSEPEPQRTRPRLLRGLGR